MNDLNDKDRALLEFARQAYEPTEGDRRRVRTALLGRLGMGAGLAATALTAPAAVSAGLPVATKVIMAVVIAGAVGGGGVVYRGLRTERPQPAGAHVETRVPARETVARRPASTVVDPLLPLPLLEPAAEIAPMPSAPAARAKPVATRVFPGAFEAVSPVAAPPPLPITGRTTATAPPPFHSPSVGRTGAVARLMPQAAPLTLDPTTIEEETRLVRAGVAARNAGNATRALRLLDEHARRYPNGVLAEERRAERVVALAAAGRATEARAAALLFVRVHPRSPLSARVRTAAGFVADSVTDGEGSGHIRLEHLGE